MVTTLLISNALTSSLASTKTCLDMEKINQDLALVTVENGLQIYAQIFRNKYKINLSIAIVDKLRTLKAYGRNSGFQQNDDDSGMNEAWKKARKAASNTRKYTDGGVPIRNCKNELLGAIGVSGASSDRINHIIAKRLLERIMLYCAGDEIQCLRELYKVKEHDKEKKCIEEINENTAMYGVRLGMVLASKYMKEKWFIGILDAKKNLKSYVRMDGAEPSENDQAVIPYAMTAMEKGDYKNGAVIRSSTKDQCSGKVIGGIAIAGKPTKSYKKVAALIKREMKICGRSQWRVKECMNIVISNM